MKGGGRRLEEGGYPRGDGVESEGRLVGLKGGEAGVVVNGLDGMRKT
jgi:hypothetical protein